MASALIAKAYADVHEISGLNRGGVVVFHCNDRVYAMSRDRLGRLYFTNNYPPSIAPQEPASRALVVFSHRDPE